MRRYQAMRRDAEAGRIEWPEVTEVVQGWVNHVRHGDTMGLRRAVLESPKKSPVGVPPTPPEV